MTTQPFCLRLVRRFIGVGFILCFSFLAPAAAEEPFTAAGFAWFSRHLRQMGGKRSKTKSTDASKPVSMSFTQGVSSADSPRSVGPLAGNRNGSEIRRSVGD